ncbi:addiction module protein [Gelidibacter sp.]|uniref:addiction module protein n=1 Tax=Gelidibacter sp. TaxID=2018083 RepID=UPI002B5523EF|nr:addiction module protein [Gelidibacter sp.]HUH26666.1 addiction module protein [Gelidibacter sp.]
MDTLSLRRKLIKQFDAMINNDDKLIALEGVFDVLNSSDPISKIPDEHYDIISESREQYLNGRIEGVSWEELKRNLNSKYGI